MNIETSMNVVSFDAEITTVISKDDVVTNSSPLTRPIKFLIHVAIESERCFANLAMKSEILIAILKRL